MDSVHVLGECSPKTSNYGRVSKKCYVKISPEKRTISGNFTQTEKTFNVTVPEKYNKMRRDLFSIGSKKTGPKISDKMLEEFEANKMFMSDNPTYEDPRDVIVTEEKPTKPPRKRMIQNTAVISPRGLTRDTKSLLKEQKRRLTKKYESLIVTLMDRCEENVLLITEKETHISKLKEKLKSVLEYNKLFANENDQLKEQHTTLLKYIEDCKLVIQRLEERNKDMEMKNKELGERVKKFEVPDRDESPAATAVPLVEVCMSCSSRQIILTQVKDHNTRLQKDMQALKDVLYRLNVQLAKYQERLRNNMATLASDGKDYVHKPSSDAFDSLITASLGYKQDAGNIQENSSRNGQETPVSITHSTRVVDLSGLLSAQALAPLFDAYQENIQEKEILILDYEKQFEVINRKSKQVLDDNRSLQEKVSSIEKEVLDLTKREKRLSLDRETLEVERQTLLERAEKAESKLKEVYELYEGKMSAMMRDYETIHREYFAAKNALAASEGKMARLDATMRDRTVPADLHERRVDHCKRLLDELKHQYSIENTRKTEELNKLQEQMRQLESKLSEISAQYDSVKQELSAALRNVRLYRKAAVIFRQRLKASNATMNTLRKTRRRTNAEPLRIALHKLEKIKTEIKQVKCRAYTSLEELERRIVQQSRRAERAEDEYRRELERAQLVLQHKEGIIRSLIDKVADVEEVRLSQSNTHRLQGIVTDSSPEETKNKEEHRKEEKKLTPGHGGYYQERKDRRRSNQS